MRGLSGSFVFFILEHFSFTRVETYLYFNVILMYWYLIKNKKVNVSHWTLSCVGIWGLCIEEDSLKADVLPAWAVGMEHKVQQHQSLLPTPSVLHDSNLPILIALLSIFLHSLFLTILELGLYVLFAHLGVNLAHLVQGWCIFSRRACPIFV